MFSLIPRGVRFVDLFEQQSQHIIEASQLLHDLVHHFDDPGHGRRPWLVLRLVGA